MAACSGSSADPSLPDARALREITDTLRVLIDRADAAGSTTARAMLTMTAEAMHKLAVEAEMEVEMPARRPEQVARWFRKG